jgi:hypothetical protein
VVPYFSQVLASQKANGTLFNAYTTAKTVLNPTELVQIPGNYLQLGSKLRIRVWGGLSNIVTTPGTVTFQCMMGPTSTIVAYTSGALQMTNAATTLSPFELDLVLRLNATGTSTSAAFIGGGHIVAPNLALAAGAPSGQGHASIMTPITAPANGTGFDSTVTNVLDFWVGFSISNAGNGVQLYDYLVEQLS